MDFYNISATQSKMTSRVGIASNKTIDQVYPAMESSWGTTYNQTVDQTTPSGYFMTRAHITKATATKYDTGLTISRYAAKFHVDFPGRTPDHVLYSATLAVSVRSITSFMDGSIQVAILPPSFNFNQTYLGCKGIGGGFGSFSGFVFDELVFAYFDVTSAVAFGSDLVIGITHSGDTPALPFYVDIPADIGERNWEGLTLSLGAQLSIMVYDKTIDVTCLPATNISTNSAILNGKLLTAPLGAFCYFTFEGSQSPWVARGEGGEFSWPVGGLEPDTNYSFTAHATDGSESDSSTCNFRTLAEDEETVSVTKDLIFMGDTWVLVSIEEFPVEGAELYCGVQWWKEGQENLKTINWYNPPGGATKITSNVLLHINIGGLQAGVTYYWRAYEIDQYDGVYLGIIKSFTMPSVPPVIFGTGEGYDYRSTLDAARGISKLARGRMFVDKTGNIRYEDRTAR